jgi:transposase
MLNYLNLTEVFIMSKKCRRYSAEFKQEAVKLALHSPSVSGAAKELGIPEPTLHTWVVKLKDVMPKAKAEVQQDIAKLLEENRSLVKENARLKQEKEILKKAAAYFARESE